MLNYLKIEPICAFYDNYIWVIRNGSYAAVVDPGDAQPVLNYFYLHKLQLCAILITHHHNDHIGGILTLIEHFPEVKVYGPVNEVIFGVNNLVKSGQNITIEALSLDFMILSCPGHTLGHIAYYASYKNHEESYQGDVYRSANSILFCGDTLFAGGCGRLFEGTALQMFNSLGTFCALPAQTLVYCAHEYTVANLSFAMYVEPDNLVLRDWYLLAKDLRQCDKPTVPTTIAHELATNLFLRCNQKSIIRSVTNYRPGFIFQNALDVFTELRAWKNFFKI